MAAVDQDRELNRPGPAEVGERIEGRTHRPAGEQHVIDEDDKLVLHAVRRQLGLLQGAHSA